jgi:hypothetical protein
MTHYTCDKCGKRGDYAHTAGGCSDYFKEGVAIVHIKIPVRGKEVQEYEGGTRWVPESREIDLCEDCVGKLIDKGD